MTEKEIKELFKKINIHITNTEKASNSYNSCVYIINGSKDKYVLKIYNSDKKRLNEKKYYNYLYKYVPTSKVLYSGIYNEKQVNILTFCKGNNIYDEDCNTLSKNQITNIGKLLANIHSLPLLEENNNSWILYLKNRLEKVQESILKVLSKEDNEILKNYIKNYINENIDNKYKNTILHMDFRVGNLIIKNDDEIGIIDLESMKNGEYVFDFVKMYRIFNKDNFNAFLKGYKFIRRLDPMFEEKLKFYSLFDSYTSLYWSIARKKTDTNFYKLNYSIVLKFLNEIKNKKNSN